LPAFLLEQRVDDVVQYQRDILERLSLGWHGVLSHRATELFDGSVGPHPELRYVKLLPPLDETDPAERLNAYLRRRAQ